MRTILAILLCAGALGCDSEATSTDGSLGERNRAGSSGNNTAGSDNHGGSTTFPQDEQAQGGQAQGGQAQGGSTTAGQGGSNAGQGGSTTAGQGGQAQGGQAQGGQAQGGQAQGGQAQGGQAQGGQAQGGQAQGGQAQGGQAQGGSTTAGQGGTGQGGTPQGGTSQGGAGQGGDGAACDLTDDTPDDCYDVPFPDAEVQNSIWIQSSGQQMWPCYHPGKKTFPAACFQNGDPTFPSGSWKNAVFEEGKIVSIEIPAKLFAQHIDIGYDSVNWGDTKIGSNGAYDISVSRLPGDFTDNLPKGCRKREEEKIFIQNAAKGPMPGACVLEPTKTYYLNLRLHPGTCTYGIKGPPLSKCSHTIIGYGNPGW